MYAVASDEIICSEATKIDEKNYSNNNNIDK